MVDAANEIGKIKVEDAVGGAPAVARLLLKGYWTQRRQREDRDLRVPHAKSSCTERGRARLDIHGHFELAIGPDVSVSYCERLGSFRRAMGQDVRVLQLSA